MALLQWAVDDNSLDDAELWDFIDSTVARRSSYKSHPSRRLSPTPKPLRIAHPLVAELPPSPQTIPRGQKRQLPYKVEPADTRLTESKQRIYPLPQKIVRRDEQTSELGRPERFERVVDTCENMQRSYQTSRFPSKEIVAHNPFLSSAIERPRCSTALSEFNETRNLTGNCSVANEWMAGLPSASLFKHVQTAALSILEKGDYVVMQGKPFIKKCGWRKIAFFFNVSFEIKDRMLNFDQSRNVERAEFVVRASMQSGRFADAWGSCDRGEKKFSKPNSDIACIAETRAKTRACQDLLGIGDHKSASGW